MAQREASDHPPHAIQRHADERGAYDDGGA
jgi:hypothetical protein